MAKRNGGKALPLERVIGQRFRLKLTALYPNGFVYKIPDAFGLGGMRPFDCFAIINGCTFCIEFKRGVVETVTDYQKYHLGLAAMNGAYTFVVNEKNRGDVLEKISAIISNRGGL